MSSPKSRKPNKPSHFKMQRIKAEIDKLKVREEETLRGAAIGCASSHLADQ
jgi:hypothetical protein